MASLREIKDHIESVRSTLKITSAMKLVASAKLRKAQQAAEGIRPYTEALSQMLAAVMADRAPGEDSPSASKPTATGRWAGPPTPEIDRFPGTPVNVPQGEPGPDIARPMADAPGIPDGRMQNGRFCIQTGDLSRSCMQNGGFCIQDRVAIVAVASNSSLCGAFNINVIHKVQELIAELKASGAEIEVFSVGRKMAEAMRKAGFPSPADYSELVGRNSFEKSAAFAQELIDAYESGRYSKVILVYNHFVSTASQKVLTETYLPFGGGNSSETAATLGMLRGGTMSVANGGVEQQGCETVEEELPSSERGEFILEPSREEILATLLPQVMRLRIHTVLLDSIAAEHAARTIAMQTASDNAEDLLSELTLEYNKGRQQKITAEILDLVGGAQQ